MGTRFHDNRFLQLLLVWLVGLWIVTAIEPFNRRDWLLENLLVFIYGALLIATYRRFPFSNLSYGLFGVFLSLHLVGAHYTYAETPLGFWLQEAFGLQRNHYDRIVHFLFGLLLAYPFRELLMRAAGVRRRWSYLLVIVTVLGKLSARPSLATYVNESSPTKSAVGVYVTAGNDSASVPKLGPVDTAYVSIPPNCSASMSDPRNVIATGTLTGVERAIDSATGRSLIALTVMSIVPSSACCDASLTANVNESAPK